VRHLKKDGCKNKNEVSKIFCKKAFKERKEGRKEKIQRQNILTGWEKEGAGVKAPLRLTGLFTLRRLTAARATKNRSRAPPFVRFFSATFFCARKNASHFFLSDAKKRHIQPTLCAIVPKNFVKI
jgi:hypothetical protein